MNTRSEPERLLPLAKQDVGSPRFMNDLFGVVSFHRHGSDPLSWLFTTFDLGQLMQAGHFR